ncbi:class A beta-lactamase-related serine hydrolase [Pseudoroseomonas wenyumeiae]|uniref:Class A beta-lactamase-related serine hydrolase n=1 Tax=Teichococcus wenyumeiae TaxID=2478470 RepID=A0A3A9JP52_9PROT|nr:serine hydrolase domain-containing protein [Pseudoroseomonas wenyumeiae]RKK05656.1 class A beta-lactamase-related serine hydrolase [Pseudoroseomonas wenyumeiae]RMI25108.1 class A beta-lactamase-related serine hydrolase [Pseudoroseomonas wenyumeiae]
MPDWTRATTEADRLARAWSEAAGPGGAILLFDSAGIRHAASGGFASLEHAIPFTPDTPNRYASISKHFLAATALLEELPLEAPLGVLLEGLPAAIGAVPLGRALDMTAALPDMMEVLWQQGVPYTAGLNAAEILEVARHLPGLNAAPGTEMAYSNTGWRLAQSIFPAQRGVAYAEALRRRLLAPLDLPIRFPEDETEAVPGLATGYWWDGASWRRGRYGMHFSASGGLAGSAAALARWLVALMTGQGPLSGVLEQLAAPRFFVDGAESVYGLGLVRSRLGNEELLGHGGSLPGYRNHFLLAPQRGLGVVVLTNREEDALWPAMTVLASLLEQPLPEPVRDLPTGLFASAEGPFWAETTPDSISFMGGYERLVAEPDGGARSLPAYLDIRLQAEGQDVLAGQVGGAERRFLRVSPEQRLDPALVGDWREEHYGLAVTIRADGTARLPWAGGNGAETRLTALPGGRALADLVHGPWRHRPCLWLQADGSLRLASHRARVLHFTRPNP